MKIMRRGKIFLGLILPGMILAMATFGAQALATQSAIIWTQQANGTYIDQSGDTCADSDGDDYWTNTCVGSMDCDDGNPNINPNVTELCSDNADNNCDGQEDEWCPDSCNENSDFFSCLAEEIVTDVSSLLATGLDALKTSIFNLLTPLSNPASYPSAGKKSSSFDSLTINDKAGLNPANSNGLFLINNTETVGSAFVNTNTEGIGMGISTNGKVGAVGMGTTGVLVEKYTGSSTIVPKIGIFAQASGTSGIGLYAVSSGATGTEIRVSDLGLYSIGSNVGIVSHGTTTGISVTAANPTPTYGDIIGVVTHETSKERAWGALGYVFKNTNYSLFTPFDSYSNSLEVVGDTNSNTLKAKILSASSHTGYVGLTTYLDTIIASGALTVEKPLTMSGNLDVNGYLDIDGNVTVYKDGGFKMDGNLKTNDYKPIVFNNDVEVSADSGSAIADIDGRVTAADGIGTFYQVKGYNTVGNPTASCASSDFLVSCSAKVSESDLYTGARPKDSDTCEAYAQKSNVTVTVYAYCFDPQGTASSSL